MWGIMTPPKKSDDVVKLPKKVAADGTKRGIGNFGKKYKTRGPLRDRVDEVVRQYVPDFPFERFDAVEMAAVVAAMAMTSRPARDSNGNPIMSEDPETGKMVPVTIPPDFELALKAMSQVQRYTHSPAVPKPVDEDDGDGTQDELRAELAKAADSIFKLAMEKRKKDDV